MKEYVADFETSVENEKTWVWCYGLAKIGSDRYPKIGGSIDDFFDEIQTSSNKSIYFHNLKFDGSFILTYLLRHGYKQTQKPRKAGEFSALVDETGTTYNIKYIFTRGNRDYSISFLDSAKLFPDTIKNLAKSFNFEVQKGELDYDKVRYEHHKLTADEEKYIINDVVILRKVMEIARERGMNKMTIASNALSYYKNMLGDIQLSFQDVFPRINDDTYKFLENAYKGGCTMLKNSMRNKITRTNVYDINNMYGNILDKAPLPFGEPVYFEGQYIKDEKYPLYVQHISCEFSIKDNCPPCIQIKNKEDFLANEWIEYSLFEVDLYLTNMDLQLLLENYNVYNLKYIDGYKFMSCDKMFTKYIQHWYKIKVEGTPVERKIAKLYNNSLYGKFGTKPIKNNVYYKLDEDGVLTRDKLVETKCKTVYIPVAIFVTSYGRYQIISNIKKVWDKFIYCDTDSIHLTEETDKIPIDQKKLGYFKLEAQGIGRYIKQKTYLINLDKKYWEEEEDGHIKKQKLVCAGLNKILLPDYIDIKDFKVGIKLDKIVARKICGGVALTKTEHEITAPLFTEHSKNGGGF